MVDISGLQKLSNSINDARKKLRSNKPVHESEQPNNDPNKWQRRAAKVVKYGLGAGAVAGGIQALGGAGLAGMGIHDAIYHGKNDDNSLMTGLGAAHLAGGVIGGALYGSGAYLAHKKAKELEVKKKQDK